VLVVLSFPDKVVSAEGYTDVGKAVLKELIESWVDAEELDGSGTSTVIVEALTLMTEYAVVVTVVGGCVVVTVVGGCVVVTIVGGCVVVTVVGGCVMDTITVLLSGPLVTCGSVSVSIIVLVAGAGVCVTVSTIVTAGSPPFAPVAEPPSTGTTEYVALLTRGLTNS
jgi:hypothetical protein